MYEIDFPPVGDGKDSGDAIAMNPGLDVLAVVSRVRLAAGVLGGPPARRWSPSQPDDQVADGSGLGEEWVVAGVDFHDAGCSTGELALEVGRGTLVLRADKVRRGHVLPGG